MLFEHLIYSTAIAIVAGMVYYRFVGKDYSWIIIASAYAPDIDHFSNYLLRKMGISLMINGHHIDHGNFHNLAGLILYSISGAFLLHPIGVRFVDSLFFAGIGFAAIYSRMLWSSILPIPSFGL
jgi:hypothetical protein